MRTINSNKYLLFNKPYGVLSQFTSEKGEDLSQFNLPPEVYPVGRLDKDSEGLLLLSNDGQFQQKFLSQHRRVYWVQVDGAITESAIQQLKSGVEIKGYRTKKCRAKIIENKEPLLSVRNPPVRFRKNIPTSWIEIELLEGKNRQVRRMTAKVGFPTLRLIRVQMGKYSLFSSNQNQSIEPGSFAEIKLSDLI